MNDKADNRAERVRQAGAAALLAALLCLSTSAQQQTITGKVVGVSDGDTITVLDASNKQYKIRLEGIDAPESNQAYGSRAKQSLSDLVFGKTVTVTSSKKDKYGRTLGKVTLDGKNVNQEQIDRGMAWFYRVYRAELPGNVAAVYELREARAVGRCVAYAAVGFQARQDCESAWREADDDGDRADRRQPQQQDLSFAELPGLQQCRGAQPRSIQDRGRSAGGWIQEGAELSVMIARGRITAAGVRSVWE